jgi:hypothetical protein
MTQDLSPDPVPTLAASLPDGVNSNRTKILIALGGAVLLVVIIAIVLLTGSSERPLKVRLGLFDAGSDCDGGSGGYDDLGPGMPITVKDQDGKLIGSSTLPEGGEPQEIDGLRFGCIWETVVMVPDDAEQYAVEGGSRGAVTYSRDTIENEGWIAELSIGA